MTPVANGGGGRIKQSTHPDGNITICHKQQQNSSQRPDLTLFFHYFIMKFPDLKKMKFPIFANAIANDLVGVLINEILFLLGGWHKVDFNYQLTQPG